MNAESFSTIEEAIVDKCGPFAERGCPLPMAIGDPALREVVGGHFEPHPITGQYPDVILAHFARDVGKDHVVIVEFYAEHRVWQRLEYRALDFKGLFFFHLALSLPHVRRLKGWRRADPPPQSPSYTTLYAPMAHLWSRGALRPRRPFIFPIPGICTPDVCILQALAQDMDNIRSQS